MKRKGHGVLIWLDRHATKSDKKAIKQWKKRVKKIGQHIPFADVKMELRHIYKNKWKTK